MHALPSDEAVLGSATPGSPIRKQNLLMRPSEAATPLVQSDIFEPQLAVGNSVSWNDVTEPK